MKLRYLTFVFTILVAVLIGVNIRQIQIGAYNTVDVTSLNKSYKQIVSGLESGEDKEELEAFYGCQIYLKTDADYSREVMDAIKGSKILMDYEVGDKLLGKIVFSGEGDLFDLLRLELQNQMIQVNICMLLIGYLIIGLIYYFYIRPFRKLQKFAENIAKGNLDAPLSIYNRDYFGAFTESFDLMREELKIARESEYKANVSKKELVAELSHDIKTPIATIKDRKSVV